MKEFLISSFILVVFPFIVNSLNESGLTERKCQEIRVQSKWMASVDKWYVPMWSKLHATRVASLLLQKNVADISEKEFRSPCILLNKDKTIAGFNKINKVEIEPTSDGIIFTFNSKSKKERSEKLLFELTDNKNFILGITCWEDLQVSWVVLSKRPKLESSDSARILSHIQSLGFLKRNVKYESYESCGIDDDDDDDDSTEDDESNEDDDDDSHEDDHEDSDEEDNDDSDEDKNESDEDDDDDDDDSDEDDHRKREL